MTGQGASGSQGQGTGSSSPAGQRGTQPAQEPLTRIRVGLSLPREVAVIAPNYYAREVADDILQQKHVTETRLKHADAILVVLRSSLGSPLRTFYDCPCELRKETSARAGFAGQKTHVYVYAVDDNLRVRRVAHDVRLAAPVPSTAPGLPAKPPL
jgi:hypothetical protein